MMGALSYLYFKKLKNRILEYFRSPSKLIFFLVTVLLISFSFYTVITSPNKGGQFRSIEEFISIVFLLYTLVFVDISKNGFSNGASFFSMADINLVFVSPTKSANALFYGIVQQLGRSLYMGFVILLQYAISYEYYGISPLNIITVAVGYGITVFLGQMCSMLIYIFTSSSDKKVRTGKFIYYSLLAFFVVFVIIKADVASGVSFEKIMKAVGSDVLHFLPVSGIVTLLVEGVIVLSPLKILLGVAAVVSFFAVFWLAVSKAKGDYYEDVLKSTEVTYSAITSAKENISFEGLARNIKVGKKGFSKGEGASAISEKHKTENRRGKLLFLNRASFVTIGTTLIYSLLIYGEPLMSFILSLYSMLITVSVGRWMKELGYPYIYLIPEKPFKKLLHVIREQIPSIIFESIVLFVPLYFILELTLLQAAAMLISRISFGFVFMAANLLFLKLCKKTEKTVFTMMLYMLIASLCSLPGAMAGFMLAFVFPFTGIFGYLATVPVNGAVFLIIIYFCRNILECAEFNNK